MPDLTYTAKGSFNQKGQINIDVCIPAEPSAGAYKVELYNMSKFTASGQINAIFCHFSDGTDNDITHDSFDYELSFQRRNLKPFSTAVEFDETMNESLFIFFHESPFDISDRNRFFAQIESLYDEVKRNGNFNRYEQANKPKETAFVPRKVGVSLVAKI